MVPSSGSKTDVEHGATNVFFQIPRPELGQVRPIWPQAGETPALPGAGTNKYLGQQRPAIMFDALLCRNSNMFDA